MKRRFITFEGPEGSGKSTQARLLGERLKSMGYEVLMTREPGGTRTGEAIRDIVQHDSTGEQIYMGTEIFLYSAARAQLVRQVIIPALKRGSYVLSDRFADSTTVYQGYGRGLDIETIEKINSFAIGEAVPDITFLLDMRVEEGFARINKDRRELDRMEREPREFHERVRNGYLELAKRHHERFYVVDASLEPGQVEVQIRDALRKRSYL